MPSELRGKPPSILNVWRQWKRAGRSGRITSLRSANALRASWTYLRLAHAEKIRSFLDFLRLLNLIRAAIAVIKAILGLFL